MILQLAEYIRASEILSNMWIKKMFCDVLDCFVVSGLILFHIILILIGVLVMSEYVAHTVIKFIMKI